MNEYFVIDDLTNIGRYASLSENFGKAVDFIKSNDLTKVAEGRTAIDGDAVYVNHDVANFVRMQDRRAEVHHRHFDVHVPLTGDEQIGLALFDARRSGSFDEARDCGFYDYDPHDVDWHLLRRGQFCITWPVTCVHLPAVTPDVPKSVHKLVFKVRA